ncbi:uncharacterized protein F5891DRAFT_948531 [Suillus fuscotomentosus]|uniref:Uncharacterized protein n=1 Tax=Suillus fuscotomentosus TaxID=1912939 RepID=A0AAD4EAI0_9AGAM|nr:uncharacterized protein F5891DRAFT_948531 [Suillus fuscotomentosus]KAG1902710.1 hypothetical protein F5891DRAFT_948531 [Suillus fuscotomentosus]
MKSCRACSLHTNVHILLTLFLVVSCEILEAKNVGIREAIDNLTERGAVDPVIKATVVLSESSFVSVGDAIVYGEIKDDSITGTYLHFFLFLIMKLDQKRPS